MRMILAAVAASLAAACAATSTPSAAPAPTALAAAPAPTPKPLGPPLSAQAIAAHVEVLASDDFEGREPVSEGERKTLDYLIAQFEAAGLEPGADGEWLQPVPLVAAAVQGAPALTVTGTDGEKAYAYGADQVVWTKREAPTVTLDGTPLVFVGYGINAPEKGWNDYDGLDMRGKIAVILINDPDFEAGQGDFEGKAMTYYGRWVYKYEEAARQGAAGALIIHEAGPASYPWAVVQSSWTGPQFAIARPDRGAERVGVEGWLSEAAGRDLFARAGLDFDALKAAAQRRGFKAKELGLDAAITLTTAFERTQSYNVVGLLKGDTRPNETVLYSAHWDHLGRCEPVEGDDICNGAQDNASGTAGLIELARAHAAKGPAARSVVFLAVTAEEQGLLGSEHYAANPLYPLKDTVAAINMDGLPVYGRTRDMTVIGYGKSELDALLESVASAQGRRLQPDPAPERGSYYRSDHFSFAKVGVPSLFARGGLDLEQGGVERGRSLMEAYTASRYHKPADEFDPSWDLGGAQQDLEAFFGVGRILAEGVAWPNWSAQAEFRAVRDAARGAP